jgi:hypothetical protein
MARQPARGKAINLLFAKHGLTHLATRICLVANVGGLASDALRNSLFLYLMWIG